MDATAFLEYFTASTFPDDATIVSLEGRLFPVQVAYLEEPVADYVQKAAEVACQINLQVSRVGLSDAPLGLTFISKDLGTS